MALTLSQIYTNACEKGSNINLATAAVGQIATSVLTEDVNTANHAARLTWAQKALAAPDIMARKMIYAILGDTNVQASQSDVNILAAVNNAAYIFANA